MIQIASLKGDVSFKAMMLKTKIRMLLYSKSYRLRQQHLRLRSRLMLMVVLGGNETQQCDAQQAYVQSELGGTETWISLPKILRPASWAEYYEPVCILRLALYGHPDAGGYWERHCEEHLTSVGFVPVPD